MRHHLVVTGLGERGMRGLAAPFAELKLAGSAAQRLGLLVGC